MSLYEAEFPDYDGEFHKPNGFFDNSYHNDMMPRVTRRFRHDINGTEIEVNIWQDYVDPDKRERDCLPRFTFSITVDTETVFELMSDDWKEIENMINHTSTWIYGYTMED